MHYTLKNFKAKTYCLKELIEVLGMNLISKKIQKPNRFDFFDQGGTIIVPQGVVQFNVDTALTKGIL